MSAEATSMMDVAEQKSKEIIKYFITELVGVSQLNHSFKLFKYRSNHISIH